MTRFLALMMMVLAIGAFAALARSSTVKRDFQY
jgi:hypothetical protein